MDTCVKIGKISLKNPVTAASGTAGYGEELSDFYDISRLGAIFTKGISMKPREGNRGPRIIETPSGVLNSIGLQNVGLDAFLKEKLPFLLGRGATVIPNIAGHTVEENVELCAILSETEGITAVELNVSCPNVKEGGIAFGRDLKIFTGLLKKARKATRSTLIVKLSPNVTDISEFAVAAEHNGADAVSAVNTFLGMKIDIEKRKPYFAAGSAGLSGPAIRPLAVRAVYEIYRKVSIPVIGLGGITCAEDILEFLMAGAAAVSIGTMNMVEPYIALRCIEKLEEYMQSRKIKSISEIIGAAHR
ncbi:MAG: dihydroorotate dehydrogenase [Spirochaetes bacterium]|nr:dihydroorotate dehydrogenase [Spirochaetota bacterium]